MNAGHLRRVDNGFIFDIEPNSRFSESAGVKVARTPDELADIVREWAKAEPPKLRALTTDEVRGGSKVIA